MRAEGAVACQVVVYVTWRQTTHFSFSNSGSNRSTLTSSCSQQAPDSPDSWVFHCLMGSQVTAVSTQGSQACHPHEKNDLFLQRWCRLQNAEIQSEGQLKCSEHRFDWQLSCVCLSLRNKHWMMAEMKINAFSSPPFSLHHPELHPPPLSTWQKSLKGGEESLNKDSNKKILKSFLIGHLHVTDIYPSVSISSEDPRYLGIWRNEPLPVNYCSFMNQAMHANVWLKGKKRGAKPDPLALQHSLSEKQATFRLLLSNSKKNNQYSRATQALGYMFWEHETST